MISCICVTRDRPEFLAAAIECFRGQTVEDRELVILASGEDVRRVVPADARIRYVQTPHALKIGAARNRACNLARGEYIAHWDDDDYSAPDRLADQLGQLNVSGKAVTGYHSMAFTDGVRVWMYRAREGKAIGTSLFYRRDFWKQNYFLDVQVGEDVDFVWAARRRAEIITADACGLMIASIHGGNTSPRKISGPQWQEI